MNAKQKLHQAHLQEWATRFADQKASGLTVKQWCEQNHFSIHTYNYWKHLLKEEVIDQLLPDIVPVTVPVASDTALPSVPTTHSLPKHLPILLRHLLQIGMLIRVADRPIRQLLKRLRIHCSVSAQPVHKAPGLIQRNRSTHA